MSNIFRSIVAAAIVAAASAGVVSAATGIDHVAACQACHGSDGVSARNSIPSLAGQRKEYLAAQLRAFKRKDRKDDLMAAITAQLTLEDIEALAAYWSALPSAGSATPAERTAKALRPRVAIPADFPNGFSVYKTVENAAQGLITRHYVSQNALAATRAGAPLPDGAAIVVENVKAKQDEGGKLVRGPGGGLIGGAPLSFAMSGSQAGWGDPVPELLRNGNRHYSQFDANRQSITGNQAVCLACHKPLAADSYVFTLKDIAAFAGSGK